jgi:hypothetical protein
VSLTMPTGIQTPQAPEYSHDSRVASAAVTEILSMTSRLPGVALGASLFLTVAAAGQASGGGRDRGRDGIRACRRTDRRRRPRRHVDRGPAAFAGLTCRPSSDHRLLGDGHR